MTIAGCAGMGPAVLPPPAPSFTLEGRAVVRGAERVVATQLRWEHANGSDEIRLLAPLGQTLAVVRGNASGAVIETADAREYRASSIESLTRTALGWPLPVAGLRFWVLGEPVPGWPVAGESRDAQGRLATLSQDGWRIVFVYPEAGGPRPVRLDLASDDAEIRLIVDALRPGEAPR